MHDSIKLILSTFAALSTCSIICGSACDFIEVGECAGPGGLFGPCDDHLAFRCLNGLRCMDTDSGNICTPPAAAGNHTEADDCAAWRGTMECSVAFDACFLACDGPDDCLGGTTCDEDAGFCVYPLN